MPLHYVVCRLLCPCLIQHSWFSGERDLIVIVFIMVQGKRERQRETEKGVESSPVEGGQRERAGAGGR